MVERADHVLSFTGGTVKSKGKIEERRAGGFKGQIASLLFQIAEAMRLAKPAKKPVTVGRTHGTPFVRSATHTPPN